MTTISLSNVDVLYTIQGTGFTTSRKIKALNNINLELESGDRLGIIGTNGSGKSTLLKVLSGALPPHNGIININGDVLSILNRTAGLLQQATLKENTHLKATELGFKGEDISKFSHKVISDANLFSRQDDPLNSLSTGMAARFNIALNSQAVKPITILDEWVGTLDMGQVDRNSLFSKLTQETEIFIIASHNEQLIRSTCNKVLLLHQGVIEYIGDDLDDAFTKLAEKKGHISIDTPKSKLHYMYFAKTGSFIHKQLLESNSQLNTEYNLVTHRQTQLKKIPDGEKVIFFIREPLERFCRAFLNRKHLGKPFYQSPWSLEEKEAFEYFLSPNQLAEALSSNDLSERFKASRAMAGITHLSSLASTRLGSYEELLKRQQDIIFIGIADQIPNTVNELITSLQLDMPEPKKLKNTQKYFETVYSNDLSDKATHNLKTYYARDIELYKKIRENISLFKNKLTYSHQQEV